MEFRRLFLPNLLIQLVAVSILILLYMVHPVLGWSVLGGGWIYALLMAPRWRAERLQATDR